MHHALWLPLKQIFKCLVYHLISEIFLLLYVCTQASKLTFIHTHTHTQTHTHTHTYTNMHTLKCTHPFNFNKNAIENVLD